MNAKETDKVIDYRSFSIFSSGCKQPNLSTITIRYLKLWLQRYNKVSIKNVFYS